MGSLRIIGIVLIGISIFLLVFVYEDSARPGWFLGLMIIPSLILGGFLTFGKEKSGYPE